MYNFRKSKMADVMAIMHIIDAAKNSLKDQGINQWQDGYPNEEIISADILAGDSFVLEIDEEIVATVALIKGIEPTYQNIYGGNWNHQGKYASIHRIAVKKSYQKKGIGSSLLKSIDVYLKDLNYYIIRVDTHYLNQSAISLFERNGFKKCGVIFLKEVFEEDYARIAFEKQIL